MKRLNLFVIFSLGIACFAGAAARQARAELIYGLTSTMNLVTLDSESLQATSSIGISGLVAGETLLGIDIRPATGQMYGLSTAGRFYRININTGVATSLANPLAALMVDLVKSFAIDPVSDQIRVVTGSGKNIRVNPNTGGAIAVDSTLKFAVGDPHAGTTPNVVHLAYTNSNVGAVSTTLFNLEAVKDVLTMQTPQNTGNLNTVGALGINLGTLLSVNGFDISGATGIGYVVGSNILPGGMIENNLYTVNLATGVVTWAGPLTAALVAEPFTFGGGGGGGGGGGCTKDHVHDKDCGGKGDLGTLIDITTPGIVVPEPTSLALTLAGIGLLAGGWLKRRR